MAVFAGVSKMRTVLLLSMLLLPACTAMPEGSKPPRSQSLELSDPGRGRRIAVELRFPAPRYRCTPARRCGVALLSPGYGLPHTAYSFLAERLTSIGYLVVAIQHDLPSDPSLPRGGPPYVVRMPAWKRGVANLRFVRGMLEKEHPQYDWARLALIGHSQGGDISALALHESPGFAQVLVTLDNRRHPLPRDPSIRVLSIRGSDFEADPGVLPTDAERAQSGACITRIDDARHDDMHDAGPDGLKAAIGRRVTAFLRDGHCEG